jgi:DNA-directed RNA polymerase specialized sigma24 family protein
MIEPDWKVASDSRPRLTFDAFRAAHEPTWAGFARARRLTHQEAQRAVDRLRERLRSNWEIALGEPTPAAYAWALLKEEMAGVTAERAANSLLQPQVIAQTWAAAVHAVAERMRIGTASWGEQLALYEAVLSLPERQQDVVLLKFGLGLADDRIADCLNTTQGSIRSTLRHARAKLDRKLSRRSGR